MFKLVVEHIKFKHKQITCIRTYKTDTVRVRFAPSPTGFLHLGGLRTALYNFLFAKKYNGKFILRIEDTDQTRLVPGAIDQLQEDLKWSGIEIDEGPRQGGNFGPYIQSERINIYREHINLLLQNGTAYHCFCTEKRLQLLRREAARTQEVPKYDNKCRHLSPDVVQKKLENGESSCIRFRLSDQEETFDDLIYGEITRNISLNEGDPVIIKSDGFPTYHFANVVDDHLMNISHVLRGVEWQVSTTKHILLYRAFNWKPPLFGHMPLLMNVDGTKLSKRQGDIKISYYRENNIFPLALINFIVHSGGGFAKDLDRGVKPKCYTFEELSDQFVVSQINTHSGKLMKERLLEFNRLELKRKLQNKNEEIELINEVRGLLKNAFPERVLNNSLQLDSDHIRSVLLWAVDRIGKLTDLISKDLQFLWNVPNIENIGSDEIKAIELFRRELEDEANIERDSLNILLKKFCKEHDIKYSSFMKTLRYILSGLKEGPSVAEMIDVLGKESTLQRLKTSRNDTTNMR